MIIKSGNLDWHIPAYETYENVEFMILAYESYLKGNYRVMRPEDWKLLYEVNIIWVHENSIAVTHPQHPQGRDLTAWLEHIWSHTEYYIGHDAHGFEYLVFVKEKR